MKRVVISICLILFTGLLSCKKEVTKKTNLKVSQEDLKPDIEFIFPDTTYLNKSYFGVINYKGKELDTFNIDYHSELEKDGKVRLIYFQSKYTRNFDEKLSFNNKIIDTFIASSNNKIPIDDIKFNELGLNFIDGLLTDEVYIKLKDGNTRIITKEYRVTQRVFVVDSTSVTNTNTKMSVIGTL